MARGGRLRVAAGAYVHDIAVQSAAIDLINANPSIRLELLEREWTAALAMLMTDRVDFAVLDVVALRRHAGAPNVESLGSASRASISAGPAIHCCKRRRLRPADVRAYPVRPSQHVAATQMALIEDIDAGFTVDPVTGDVLPSIAVSSFRLGREIVAGTDAISIGHRSQIRDGSRGRSARPFSTCRGGTSSRRRRWALPTSASVPCRRRRAR